MQAKYLPSTFRTILLGYWGLVGMCCSRCGVGGLCKYCGVGWGLKKGLCLQQVKSGGEGKGILGRSLKTCVENCWNFELVDFCGGWGNCSISQFIGLSGEDISFRRPWGC